MPWTQPENLAAETALGDVAGFQASIAGQGATSDTSLIAAAVNAASSIVRRAAGGQTISRVTDDQVSLDGRGAWVVFLPELPIVSVGSVAVDGEAWVTPDNYRVNAALGLVESASRCFPVGAGRVQVTYTHGYDAVPDDVQLVVYQVARRLLDSAPSGGGQGAVQSESIGGYSVTFADPVGESGLTSVEFAIVQGLPGAVGRIAA